MHLVEDTTLLGGWASGLELRKKIRLIQVDGNTEREYLNILERMEDDSQPETITAIIGKSIDTRNQSESPLEFAKRLSWGDRQYLLLQIDRQIQGEQYSYSTQCSNCNKDFEIIVRHSNFIIKKADSRYPQINVRHKDHLMTFQSPSGEDLESIVGLEKEHAYVSLASLCCSKIDSYSYPLGMKYQFFYELYRKEPDTFSTIAREIEDMSPIVEFEVRETCIHCGTPQNIEIPILQLWREELSKLPLDVHNIARFYSWDEKRILNLTRRHRKQYLDFFRGVEAKGK